MLKYAILGTLKIKPMSGYDIDKILNQSIKNFWNIRQSQIYNEFKKMEKHGLIVHKEVESKNKQTKKIYMITEKGESELENLFSIDNNIKKYTDVKFLALIRMFYGFTTNDKRNIEFLKKLKDACYQKLDEFKFTKENIIGKAPVTSLDHDRNVWYWTSVVNCGEYVYKSIIEWANDTITDLEKAKFDKKKLSK